MTKSTTQSSETLKNNIDADDEKCHKMTQLMLAEGDRGQEIRELVDALRKIGYFQSFQVTDNEAFSSEKPQKRRLKPRKQAKYRLIKRYYKSRKQYVKERLRRKLCWLLRKIQRERNR